MTTKSFKIFCLLLTKTKFETLKYIVQEYAKTYNFAANFMLSLSKEKYIDIKGHPSELYTLWIKGKKFERNIHALDAFYAVQDAWANYKSSGNPTKIENPNIAKFDNIRYEIKKNNEKYGIYMKPYKNINGIFLPLIVGDYDEAIEHLDNCIENQKNPGCITYNLSDNSVSIPITTKSSKKFVKKDKIETIIGIDRGIRNHVVLAAITKKDKDVIGIKLINGKKDAYNIRRLHKLNAKRKSVNQHKDIGNRIANIKDTITSQISKEIVDFAMQYPNPIIVWENLGNFTKIRAYRGCRHIRRLVARWSYGKIREKSEYKLKAKGIYSIQVNSRYTSQNCNHCGSKGIRDRIHFVCQNPKCNLFGKQYNADVNAGINIALKGWKSLYDSPKRTVDNLNDSP